MQGSGEGGAADWAGRVEGKGFGLMGCRGFGDVGVEGRDLGKVMRELGVVGWRARV